MAELLKAKNESIMADSLNNLDTNAVKWSFYTKN